MTIPLDFQQLQNAGIGAVKQNPTFQNAIVPEWHSPEDELFKATRAKYLAWVLSKQHNPDDQKVPPWTGYNHVVSNKNYTKTLIVHCH